MKSIMSVLRSRGSQPAPLDGVEFPFHTNPIRIIVGYARGGIVDLVARLVRGALESTLGTQVIVENMPGGGGTLAAQACASATPDGCTLLMASCGEMVIAPSARSDLGYDAKRAFAPIGLATETPLMIVAGPTAEFSDLRAMIAASHSSGRQHTYAIPGRDGPHHVTGEWLRQLTGIPLVSVVCEGGAPAVAEVVRGKVDLGIVALPPVLPHIRSGAAKPLAVTGRDRIDLAPNCPTIAELGYPEFDTSIWIGLVAPASTPAPVVARLNQALNSALADDEVRKGLAAYSAVARGGSPDDFASLISVETEKYRRIIRTAKVDTHDTGIAAVEDRSLPSMPVVPRTAPVTSVTPSPIKIAFRGVTKRYAARGSTQESTLALDRLDVEIKTSEIITVLGPTGCGKSSALNLIAGFERPSSGSVLVDREAVTGPAPDRAIVFQQAALFPWLSVFDNITLGVKCRGMPKDEYAARAARLIAEIGLTGFENHYPYQLSGGMQQRVQIARALISEPQVLLMDEPFGALDSQTRILMQELLLQLWLEHLPTVFFITHDVAEAIFIADRVLLMSRRPGRVKLAVDIRTPKPRTAEFLTSPEFVGLQRELLHSMQEEVRASSGLAGARAH